MTLLQARLAMQLRTRCPMLPAEKESHEVGSRHRLDLAPKRSNRAPVYTRKQSTIAPFFLTLTRFPLQLKEEGSALYCTTELATQDLPF